VLQAAAAGDAEVEAEERIEEPQEENEDDVDEEEVHPKDNQRRDLLEFAVRCTKDLANDPCSSLVVLDRSSDHAEYAHASAYDPTQKITRQGFGRRPCQGTLLVVSQTGPFREQIAEIFKNKGTNKQHASWILETLREAESSKFRLDLSTESDVRKEMQRLT